ncbi:Glycosyltransferase involved in cell wall bisynthesis [Arenibacter palladensis]|uniref:Glycosyltransferase involved in cell wall bisynthesis n=1 Tax=Arenibacter palladensis TaxID=237373 RepID=A0A1M5EKW4_9FLAO|nr:glycosyltransferase [Arenibacter palladensis]SHF79837.1 Glycosyltransferase involved in cell wall bisynthesis [Arenibacter palladensis]
MSQKINITFIIPSLRAGGAERVMSFISSNLNQNLFNATLLVIGGETDKAYEITNIRVIYLNKDKIRLAFFKIFKYLLFEKNDIVVSSIGHLNTMMAIFAIFFRGVIFVARETVVKGSNNPKNRKFLNLDWLKKYTIKKIICQSNDMKDDLITNYGFKQEKLIVINNPVTSDFEAKTEVHNFKSKELINFITVGRLAKPKGHKRILNSLAKLKFPFHYTIIGSGPEEENIKKLITKLNLDKKITFIPFTKEIPSYLASSDIYLQGSYVEGFPNALLESCAIGTPVVVFEAPGGINEIVENGINGYIAKTEDEYFNSILKMIDIGLWNPKIISNSVLKKYNEKEILKNYEAFFRELIA